MLDKVHEYEQNNKPIVDKERPVFHLTCPVGWMNDPNGFSTYKDEYHLFFQYYPFDTIWGSMHWGHAKTNDFVRWEHLPAALAPDQPYDQNGCFSGGAIELKDGRQLIIYSGVTPLNYNIDNPVEDLPPESDRYQNQCIAIGDGITYEKSGHNPVLVASTVPEGGSLVDFRDPKIWQEGDDYYAVISNRPASGNGDVLLYRSKDAFQWEFVTTLISNDGSYGRMWECPDLFSLDGRDVILVSPMEMKEQGLEYHNGHITMAIIGSYDKDHYTFKDEKRQAVDYGIDFYSTQSLLSKDGRRIMIAWMQNWCETDIRMDGLHFYGQNTIPRELHIVNDRLIQNPVRELMNYRQNKVVYENQLLAFPAENTVNIDGADGQDSNGKRIESQNSGMAVSDEQTYEEKGFDSQTCDMSVSGEHTSDKKAYNEKSFDGIQGRILDLTIELMPTKQGSYQEFSMKLAKNDDHHLLLQYDPTSNIVSVDRRKCGKDHDKMNVGRFYVRDQQGKLKLRLLLDKYSLEIFANDGEQAASYSFYTDLSADQITFSCKGQVNMNIEKYDIVVD